MHELHTHDYDEAIELGRPIALGFYQRIEAVRPKKPKGCQFYGIGVPSFLMTLPAPLSVSRSRRSSIRPSPGRSVRNPVKPKPPPFIDVTPAPPALTNTVAFQTVYEDWFSQKKPRPVRMNRSRL